MKKFSKIVAGMLLAGMTMLSACTSAEQKNQDIYNYVYGVLYFTQPVEKATEMYVNKGFKPPIYFDDLNSIILALRAKKIDVIEDLPQPVADYICSRNQDMLARVPIDKRWSGNITCKMGVATGNDNVFEILNNAIKELNANGKLEVLQKKYVDAYLQKGKEPKPVTMPKFANAQTIKVAVTGDMPPIDLVTADGTPAGFNVALLSEIAKLKKVNIVLVPINSGTRFICLNKKVADAIFYTDTIVCDAKKAGFWALPASIQTTDIYAQYPIRYIGRK
ncbi:MAG: transporter substrate-binding domain-containing protein [Phascolarctobacterium sp.]|nr:transporter substrate-binding domain-containing protein [Candidatus Phascolarctobacterium caballi]